MRDELLPSVTDAETGAFQQKLFDLMRQQTFRYTRGESSSVPVGTARELLESVIFTLGLDSGPARVKELSESDLSAELERGVEQNKQKAAYARRLWQSVCLSLPEIENLSLHDTLKSIGKAFKLYDARYFAHALPCDIDYQLALPVSESLRGMDYLIDYLRRLTVESRFIRRFKSALCVKLLEKSCPDYRGQLINLFEPVVINALGLTVLGKNPTALDITESDRALLIELLAPLPKARLISGMSLASSRLGRYLLLEDEAEKRYLRSAAAALCPRLYSALKSGALDGVFLSLEQ